jgi:hypothetical protein
LISQAVAAAGAGGSAPGRPGALPESLSQIHVRISHFERQSAREDTTITEQRKQGRQGRARRGELKSMLLRKVKEAEDVWQLMDYL